MTQTTEPRVFVAGPATWNHLVYVDDLPAPHPHTELVRAHHETVGGTSAGKALNLRSLGAAVTLRTHLGDDDAGRRIEERLRAAGVDLVVEPSDRTERHLNLMDAAGGRLSLHLDKPGARPEQHADLVASALADSAVAMVDLADEARPLLARAREARVPLVCDLHNYDGADPFRHDFVEAADMLFLSDEAMPDAVPWMRERVATGTSIVVITQGAHGATAVTRDGELHVPAPPVTDVVDTNGAGDAFVAGFVVARLRGAALPMAMAAGHRQAARCLAVPDLAPPASPPPT
jgi:sugar/nucleoside kinase (ribokinase family)